MTLSLSGYNKVVLSVGNGAKEAAASAISASASAASAATSASNASASASSAAASAAEALGYTATAGGDLDAEIARAKAAEAAGSIVKLTSVTGTGDAMSGTVHPAQTAIALGVNTDLRWLQPATNTSVDPTITIDGVTYVIKQRTGDQIPAGGLPGSRRFNGKIWQVSPTPTIRVTDVLTIENLGDSISTNLSAEIARAQAAEALLAPKASPAFTGTPTAPTAATSVATTQIATTAFASTLRDNALAASAIILKNVVGSDTITAEHIDAASAVPAGINGRHYLLRLAATNTTSNVTLNVGGSGPLPVYDALGGSLQPGDLQGGARIIVACFAGTSYRVISALMTPNQMRADIQSAIDALVGAAPGTLDTLAELAAVLGEDENFATTVTNALAAKAPLASPALTGVPTAPTATSGTATQQIATTEFVAAAQTPFASYAAAQAAPKPSLPDRIGATVEGQLQEWLRDPAGTALGGGWKAAGGVTARAFNGNLAAAHATGKPVDYGDVLWPSDSSAGYINFYGSTKYRTALNSRIQSGTDSSPVSACEPISATVKFTSADRDVDPGAWTQTGYYGLIKKSGAAFGAALTGYARSDGGSGDMIGGHMRAQGTHANAEIFGGWSYAHALPSGGTGFIREAITHEFDMVNSGSSCNFTDQFGTYRGIIVTTADNSKSAHIGIDVGKGISAAEGWLYGIRLRSNGIVAESDTDGKTTQLKIEGSTSSVKRYTGILFSGPYFQTGIDFRDVTGDFSSYRAIALRPNDRITFNMEGDTPRHISYLNGDNALSIQNMFLKINGNQVIRDRLTGWGAATGTATRTTFATGTVTTAQLAERVKALIDDLMLHGLIGA